VPFPQELEAWLKTSIAGIVLLGALGSILAVLLGRLALSVRRRFISDPYRSHLKRRQRFAYYLGFAHALIEEDKSGRRLATFLAYRISRFLASLVLFLVCAVLASNVLVFQEQVALTIGLFLSITIAFLALYWAYFEFEYIHRTYLWVWKKQLAVADEGYKKYEASKQQSVPAVAVRTDSTEG